MSTNLGFSDLIFIQRPNPSSTGSLLALNGDFAGARLCLLEPAAPAGNIVPLADLPEGDIQGFDLSPDATQVVFSAKLSEFDRYHLLLLDIRQAKRGPAECLAGTTDVGPACRLITFGPSDDTDPFYLPDGRIAFSRANPDGPVDFRGRIRSRVLLSVDPTGGSTQQLDVEPGHVLGASFLPNGRIQALRWMESVQGAVFRPVGIDPTGSTDFVLDGPVISDFIIPIRPVMDSHDNILAACVSPFSTWGAGNLCQRDSQGIWNALLPFIPAGNGCAAEGRLRDPTPIDDHRYVVSYAKNPSGCLNADDERRGLSPDFGIAVLDKTTGERSPLFNQPDKSEIAALPLLPRSLLQNGVLLPQNPEGTCDEGGVVFEGFVGTDLMDQGASRVRVLRALSGADLPWALELGAATASAFCGEDSNHDGAVDVVEAPIHSDGSFRLRAPAEAPLRLQVIDHYGASIQTDPIWRGGPDCSVRRCDGCHANGGRPEGIETSMAHALSPALLNAPSSSQQTFDFRRDIQPIFNNTCAISLCHDATTHAGTYVTLDGRMPGLNLSGAASGRTSAAYQTLLAKDLLRESGTGRIFRQREGAVSPGHAQNSRLVQRLGVPCRTDCGTVPSWAEWAVPEAKKHPEDQIGWSGTFSDSDRHRIVDWIEAGAPFYSPGANP
jgi:hypothetical protein